MATCSILKLGGSIITEKHRGRSVVREELVHHIARELARVWRAHPERRLVLLYGGGSFGHPLARRYRLVNAPLTRRTLIGFGHTTTSMRELGNRLAGIFLAAGLPVIPLQTSTFADQRNGRLHFASLTIFKTILSHRGIPLLGGDIVIADRKRTVISSADALAVALATHFRDTELLFATDVDGVYKRFPPPRSARPIAHISRAELGAFTRQPTPIAERDVTGGMIGKLKALSKLRNTEVVIFNGTTPKNFRATLNGEHIGTVVHL